MITLCVGAGLLALIYGLWLTESPPSALRSTIKTGATALLALAGWQAGTPGLIVAGLALGALGDLLLSRPSQSAFLAGMAAFALGHLAYIAAFLPLIAAEPMQIAAATGLAALLLLSCRFWLWPHAQGLAGPVAAYSGVIAAMLAAAFMLGPGHLAIQTGAALFTLSDVLLALRLFRTTDAAKRRLLSHLLWPAYWLGQALILSGTLMA